jgi:AcrR family transcriptional regulator
MRAEKTNTNIRKEQIAEAGLKLVAAGGMKQLSVARIARYVGVVPSALYRHYKNKDAVLDAVLDLIQDKLMGNVQIVEEQTHDPIERLYKLLMRHIKLIRENEGIPRIVFSEDVYSGHQGRKQRIYAIISGYLGRIEKIVSQGQKSGVIRKDVEPKNVALIFFGLVQPSAVLWHISDGDFDITRQARKSWEILEKAIRQSAA